MIDPIKITANRDKTVQITKSSADQIHVRLSRIDYSPVDPNINTKREKIIVLSPAEFEENESLQFKQHPMLWFRSAGWTSAFVCHDGRLLSPEERTEIVSYRESLMPKPKVADPDSVESLKTKVRKLENKLKMKGSL